VNETGEREARLWATWRALTGETLPADARALVAAHPEVVAATVPDLGMRARAVQVDREGRPLALVTTVEREFESWHLVALLNWREGPALSALSLDQCDLEPGAEWLVYDFWGRASLGIASHAVGRRLPARSSLLLSLRANLRRPQLVGTTGHVSVGAVELHDVEWREEERRLRGTAAPGDQPLDLMIRSPHPYVPTRGQGGALGELAEARVALTLDPASTARPWSIAFAEVSPLPSRLARLLGDRADNRLIPFAGIGNSGGGENVAEDMEEILAREWAVDVDRDR
jgi:hypothetical protein